MLSGCSNILQDQEEGVTDELNLFRSADTLAEGGSPSILGEPAGEMEGVLILDPREGGGGGGGFLGFEPKSDDDEECRICRCS